MIKQFIQDNGNHSIQVSKNTHPILLSSLEVFYNKDVEVIVDNQIDLNILQIGLFDLLEILNKISNTLSFFNNYIENNKVRLVMKIRDYYDEVEFIWALKCNSLNNNINYHDIMKKLSEDLGKSIKMKFRINKFVNKDVVLKIYLPKKK